MADNFDAIDEELYNEEDEDTLKDRYFTFQVGDEEYGIEIIYVLEVIGMQKITEVPEMPDFVKGVINLRGQVIPIMDIRLRFNMEPREYDDRTCIVVVQIKETAIGMVVDSVSDVLDIPADNVDPAPKISKKQGARFIKGLGKTDDRVKILLDIQKLLYDEEVEQVVSASGEA